MDEKYYKKYLKYKHKYALLKNKLYEQLGAGIAGTVTTMPVIQKPKLSASPQQKTSGPPPPPPPSLENLKKITERNLTYSTVPYELVQLPSTKK